MRETINGSDLQYPVLSEGEMEVFEKLKSADVKGVWSLAVKDLVNDFSELKFRNLICDLKSQAEGHEKLMKNILGSAYESVMSL